MAATPLLNVFAHVAALITADAVVTAAKIPTLSQLDSEFNDKYEAALRKTREDKPKDGPGLAFTLWCTGGAPADGNDSTDLDLNNSVIIGVSENPKNNGTERTALAWVSHLLRLLHQAELPAKRGRAVLRHPARGPVYELAGLEDGLVLYVINLEVRTFDELTPAT